MNVLRDRQPNYVTLSDGSVRNGYTIKVLNKETTARAFSLSADVLPSPIINLAGQRHNADVTLQVPADDTMDFRIYLTESDLQALDQKTDFNFVLKDLETGEVEMTRAIFISGGPE
jgi:polyferredoxin